MGSPSRPYRRWELGTGKKSVIREWEVQAVLSTPVPDIAGDIVRPEGLDFTLHEADPWVDLEHGRTQEGRRPVGWARKSLSKPGAPYAVEWAELDVTGVGLCRVPVGTTYFDPDDALQRQVYELIRRDALPGVSLEFVPLDQRVIAAQSFLEPHRPAYEFRKAKVLRWSHCAEPVCPDALTVLKSLPPGVEVIAKAVRDGRLDGKPLHPYIRDTYAWLRSMVTVTGVEMDKMDKIDRQTTIYDETDSTDDLVDETDSIDDLVDEANLTDDQLANNGVSALYAHAQALIDAATQLSDDLKTTDNPDLFRQGQELAVEVRALAEKVKALADEHDQKLQAMKGESTPDDPAGDMGTDETGQLKSMRRVYRALVRRVRGRRYKLVEVLKGIEAARNPLSRLEDLKKRDPEGWKKLIEPRIQKLRQYGGV